MTAMAYASSLEGEARRDFERMDPSERQALLRIVRENHDNRGRSRREVTTPPLRGSRKHPW
jgi:hypothetical protein